MFSVVFVMMVMMLTLDSLHCGLIDSSRFESVFEPLLLEVLADDDKETLSFFVCLPLDVGLAGEEHADAVENKLILTALDGQKAFHPVDVLAFLLQNCAEELVCSLHCNIGRHLVRKGTNSRIVFVHLSFVVQNLHIDLKNAIDAERLQVQEFRKRQLFIVELDFLDNCLSIVLVNLLSGRI